MSVRRPIEDERNALVLQELEHIQETIARLESVIATLSSNLDAVRVAELVSIRANLADTAARITAELARQDREIKAVQATQDSEIKLLRYQMGRTNAIWGLVVTPITAAIVAGVMQLLMSHRT